jgi:hypothetical protein
MVRMSVVHMVQGNYKKELHGKDVLSATGEVYATIGANEHINECRAEKKIISDDINNRWL